MTFPSALVEIFRRGFMTPGFGPQIDMTEQHAIIISNLTTKIAANAKNLIMAEPVGGYGAIAPCWAVVLYQAAELATMYIPYCYQVVNDLGQCLAKLAPRFKIAGESSLTLRTV